MSLEQERDRPVPAHDLPDDDLSGTLTDLMDRIDREAFRRALGSRAQTPTLDPDDE